MQPTQRAAVQGFPLAQLERRVVGMAAAGQAVTFCAQRGGSGGGLMRRVPVARWVARDPSKAANDRSD